MNGTIASRVGGAQQFADFYTRATVIVYALHALASLRIADHIGELPVSIGDLAAATGTHPDELHRVTKLLVTEGFLSSDAAGRIGHTEYSRILRSDHPMSIQPMLAMRNHIEAACYLGEGMRTGRVPHEIRFGKSAFEYLGEDPEAARTFAEFMSRTTAFAENAIFRAHRFQPFSLAVDVGGSHGSLLKRLLTEYPSARGILFDLPDVAQQAARTWKESPVGPRLRAVGGSFFESVPDGADLYLLKQILHDWTDRQCAAILRNIRRAIAPRGKVVVVEQLLPESDRPNLAWAMDIWMLMITGGRERTLPGYTSLLSEAGFAVERVTATGSPMNVIEAVAV